MGSVPQVSTLRGPVVNHQTKVRLHQLFTSNANLDPGSTALVHEDITGSSQKFTFGTVEEKSNKLARALIKITSGKKPNGDGDRIVGICMEPSPELIISILAIWKSGCSYLTFAPNAPVNRTKHIIQEASPILVITDKNSGDLYNPTKCCMYSELENASKNESGSILKETESYKTQSDPIVIILYTSGSTGISKGVRLRNSSALNRLNWQWREFPFEKNENYSVFKTSLTFVDSFSEIWAPLLEPKKGRALVIVPSAITTNPHELVALLHKYKIERLLLVPSLLKSILLYLGLSDNNKKLLESLKIWVCSGETLSVPLALEFFEKLPSGNHHLYNYYGSTEVMGDVTYYKMSKSDDVSINGKVPIGIPVDNTIIYLLDADLKVVNLGQMGELYVAGSHVADGYVNKRDMFRFIDNPHTIDPEYTILYKTGDYGRIVKGILVFEGRTDSQIKVRGNRVDLAEVETALNKINGVQKGVVLCHNLGESDQQIVAFVLPESRLSLDQKGIEKELLKSVAEYAIPQVVIINKMPYLVNGKVDRQSLLAYYLELGSKNGQTNGSYDLSYVPEEKKAAAECLFNTVLEVLGNSARGKISCQSNFYELGGNSLNSVITISKLKEKGFLISITDFIMADNLSMVLSKIHSEDEKDIYQNGAQFRNKYNIRVLEEKDKDNVVNIVADSFFKKSDIEIHMVPPVNREEYVSLLEAVWPYLVKHGVSLVALNDNNEIMGANLVFRMEEEPSELDMMKCQLMYVLEFLDYIEIPIKESMLPKEKVLHAFMLGTDQRLTPQENVEITEILEYSIMKLGKENNFNGVFTTNTSPLTQQLAVVNDFKDLNKYQINQYVAPDGTRPFKNVPDECFAICAWKPL